MSDSTERERAQLYAGFTLAWRLIADTYDIAQPLPGTLDNDPVWKRLKEIAAGEVTLTNRPEMVGAIGWNRQDAQDILDWHERLNEQGRRDR